MPLANPQHEMSPSETLAILRSRVLTDGFQIVLDLEASHDRYLRDALSGKEFLDFYSFFAAQPIGYNHPRLKEPDFQADLLLAASTKVANPDMYTRMYGEFVRTLDRVAGLPGFEHFFFIDGGALAVENALKTAFDWKVRKNLAAGRCREGDEIGYKIIHFKQAFHGRSGYTLSLTNTFDPRKTMYFPKFDWPRIDNPAIDFTLEEPERSADAAARERRAVQQIENAVARYGHDLAAIIIEPIQGEGGDNHFRREFFQSLRDLCDKHEMLLIFDEVQTGIGLTGKMWHCEHFGVMPDVLCFGKKMQICGLMATRRVDDVDSVFKVSSRINSTFGGNLTDMTRAAQYLKIIEAEQLVEHAAEMGEYLLDSLRGLARKHPRVSAVRGRGLMCAFSLPDTKTRDALKKACFERQMLMLGCGDRAVRFRPVLDVEAGDIDRGMAILDEALRAVV